jgi:predicted nucleic acid-binding protein
MGSAGRVCVDSNAMTYLVEAMSDGACPVGSVAAEKIALLRIYLYREDILYLSPTVKSEYQNIRDNLRRFHHEQMADILLDDITRVDSTAIEARKTEYLASHDKEKDCRILAECELGGGNVLLTYDQKFLRRLQGKTRNISLSAPSEFWAKLAIPKGVRPSKILHSSNPLSKQTWWVWQEKTQQPL